MAVILSCISLQIRLDMPILDSDFVGADLEDKYGDEDDDINMDTGNKDLEQVKY